MRFDSCGFRRKVESGDCQAPFVARQPFGRGKSGGNITRGIEIPSLAMESRMKPTEPGCGIELEVIGCAIEKPSRPNNRG